VFSGFLTERLAGLVFASRFFWGIDTDKSDSEFLSIGCDSYCIAICGTDAFVLAGEAEWLE